MNNPDNKIFIGGLAPMTTQETLINYFSQFGELTEAKLVMDKNTGQSKGYAFIFFKELADAQRAVEGGSAIIDGKRCNCNLASSHVGAQQQQQHAGEVEVKKVFVGGINPATTRETVHAAFAQFGEVADCKLIMDQTTGFSKGYGFVEFISPLSAQKATASGFILIDEGDCKVFVGGLAPSVTSESLAAAMAPYGKVESAKVVVDKVTQASKGFGFVEFANSKAAQRVAKTGYVLVEGKNCNCNIASQGGNNNNNNNNNNAMAMAGMGMGFSQMAMPYAIPYTMPMTGAVGFQSDPLDTLSFAKEQLYAIIQGSTTAGALITNTRMAIESFASMYGGDLALQTPMAMQQPYGYTATNQNMSLLKRPFGSQSGMDTSEVKNKKPKPNEVTQAWPTTAYSAAGVFPQAQFDITGGYRR